ncbi:MAG: tetratricopeptide repeat protein [Pyrinomonadaceae bacterium]
MKRIVIILSVVVFALAGFGCSQSGDAENANANASAEAPAQFTDANAALAEGNRLFDENQTEAAIEALKQAIVLNPDLAEAHYKLGVAYALLEMQMERTGRTPPVETDADGKKITKPRSERAFEKAVEAYEKWLKENKEDDVAHFNLGRTYSKLLKDEEAEEHFREAVKLKPDDTEYQTELGAVLIKLAEYRSAIGPLKKAIELDETNDRAIALLEDAEAGRSRVDYVPPKTDSNTAANKADNSNSNTDSNAGAPPSNSRPAANRPPANKQEVPRSRVVKTPVPRSTRPN